MDEFRQPGPWLFAQRCLAITAFDVRGAATTQPETINTSGQTAGLFADFSGVLDGFSRNSRGSYMTYNFPARHRIWIGTFVGVFGRKYNGRKDGYLRRPDGTSVTVEFPGAITINSSTKAIDIKSVGVIMGNCQLTTLSNGDTVCHGFVVTGVHLNSRRKIFHILFDTSQTQMDMACAK